MSPAKSSVTPKRRVRDPQRREKIMQAAVELIAESGYASVSISAIGKRAGIVGSGVYRHFDSKAAVLVAIFEQVIDDLLSGLPTDAEIASDPPAALSSAIAAQIDFVVGKRPIAQVYYGEIKSLSDLDSRRLRRKQRKYIERWVDLVSVLRSDLSEAATRVLVHSAVGAIHSVLNHSPNIDDQELSDLLADSARRVLEA